MKTEIFNLNNQDIFLDIYEAKDEKANLLLVHGSVEHIGRYKEFAEFLANNGITVYAPDLRGHGRSSKVIGFYSDDKNGFELIKQDLDFILRKIKEKSSKEIFIFGHSMGSFIVRDYLYTRGNNFKGAIICGTANTKKGLAKASLALVGLVSLFKKSSSRVKFVHKIIYDRLSSKNKQNEFLSHDEKVIEAYNSDPYCGYIVTLDYAREMGKCLVRLVDEFKVLTPNIFLVSGDLDPVGGNGKEVLEVFESYRKANPNSNIRVKLYPNMYHEILNETEKNIVYQDILDYILDNK